MSPLLHKTTIDNVSIILYNEEVWWGSRLGSAKYNFSFPKECRIHARMVTPYRSSYRCLYIPSTLIELREKFNSKVKIQKERNSIGIKISIISLMNKLKKEKKCFPSFETRIYPEFLHIYHS